jgi:hypothetical protein
MQELYRMIFLLLYLFESPMTNVRITTLLSTLEYIIIYNVFDVGLQVDDAMVRVFPNPLTMHPHGNRDLVSVTVQLTLELSEEHALMVAGPGGHQLLPPSAAVPPISGHHTTGLAAGQLHVTCLSTIPGFQGLEIEENHMQPSAFRYADRRVASVIGKSTNQI